MTVDQGLVERIRSRGEEVLTQVSAELMSNPRLAKAVEAAMRGKVKVEEAAGKAFRQMNVPTRSELKRALSRIDTLEREVAALKARAKGRPFPPRKPAARPPRKPAARRPKAKRARAR
jgi:polyhydroxyalkanoate synthesis regulator phasin